MKGNYEAVFLYFFVCLCNHPTMAQLVHRRTVVAALAGILRSLDQIWIGGQHFCEKIIKK